jgi:hypothetical protein
MIDLTVVQYTKESKNTYSVAIDLTDPIQMNTSGLALLVQKVVIFLLMTPGRDYFEPELGGGLLQLAKPRHWEENLDLIPANIEDAIKAVEHQMKSRQLGIDRPAEEKLQSLGLRKENGILFIGDRRGFMLNLELKNMAGERAEFALPVIQDEA